MPKKGLKSQRDAMPQRNRSHQLETESWKAFERSIPSAWVVRRKETSDYGIDGEVEIFGESGEATGLSFLVQLKGTDETSLSKALAVRLKFSTWNYFQSMPVPVLVVRFHAPSGRLFSRWAHNFDPYYATGKKTFVFRIDESAEVKAQFPEDLKQAVTDFRTLFSKTVQFPIIFRVVCDPSPVFGISDGELAVLLNKKVASDELPLKFLISGKSSWVVIVKTEEIRIELAGMTGAAMHLENGDAKKAQKYLTSDVLLVRQALSVSFLILTAVAPSRDGTQHHHYSRTG